VRALGYFFVGYLLLSFGATGMFIGSRSGLLMSVLAAVALVWLVRSYRAGVGAVTFDRPRSEDAVSGADRLLRHATALGERLPLDPLENDSYVATSYALRDDPERQGGAAAEYERRRRRLERLRRDAELLRRDAEAGGSATLVDEERRLAAELRDLEGYADALDEQAALVSAEAAS
jgi:hypothetical protein